MKILSVNACFPALGFLLFSTCLITFTSHAEPPAGKKDEPSAKCLEGTRLVRDGVKIGDGSSREQNLYERALKLCPNLAEAHYNLGLLYHNRGEYDEARTSFLKALDLKETRAFLLGLAHTEAKLGNAKEAQKRYDEILGKNPEDVSATIGKSILLDEQGKSSDALGLLQDVYEKKSQDVDLLYNMAVLYEKTGLREEALEFYKKSIEYSPDYYPGLVALSKLLKSKGTLNEAVVYLERARTVREEDPEPHKLLGVLYREIGDLDHAELSFRRAIALEPDQIESRLNLAVVLLARHQEAIADEVLREAIRMDDESARAYALQGVARYRLGDYANARSAFRNALKIEPENELAKSYATLIESGGEEQE